MAKAVLLLGAGASIDAGLPDTYGLTKSVYERLHERDPKGARLFAFVIAKLVVRNTRRGASPFSAINVEEAYDALKRFLHKDDDILGQFVSSWELLSTERKPTDVRRIKNHLERSLSVRTIGQHLFPSIDERELGLAVNEILRGSIADEQSYQVLDTAIDVLAELLSAKDEKLDYLRKFISASATDLDCIATLNYDTTVETAAQLAGLTTDYGLGNWNEQRRIKFSPNSIKLYKLHGSVNWFKDGADDIALDKLEVRSYRKPSRAMIFGGQGEKLNPDGPFITLRQDFQKQLFDSTTLAIVGYSFSDDHLNAIIRMWIASKRKGKLIVLDPNGIRQASRLTGRIATWTGQKLVSDSVEFFEIEGGFADNVQELSEQMRLKPKPAGRPKPPSLKSVRKGISAPTKV